MTWLVVVAVGIGSYLFRVAPLVAFAGRTPPPWVDRALGHAASAALAALLVSSLRQLSTGGSPEASLLAVAIAAAVAVRGGSLLKVVATGVAAHVLLVALVLPGTS